MYVIEYYNHCQHLRQDMLYWIHGENTLGYKGRTMEWNRLQVDRIQKMESYFDTLIDALKICGTSSALNEEQTLMLKELLAYYDGGDWMCDFRADEEGLVPKTLKRGILAEDTLYDFFTEYVWNTTLR